MSKIIQRAFLIPLLFLLVVICLTGCFNKQPIRIGLAAQLSGKQADLGIHLRNGVELAIEEINAAGGINGRHLELIVEDDFGTPQGAIDAENNLIDADVVAVIGHLTSDQTLTGYQIANSHGVLMFSATAAASEMTGINDLFFRTASSTDSMGRSFADYVFNDRKIKSMAIIFDGDNKSFAESWANSFSNEFNQLGGKIVSTQKIYSSQYPDFSQPIQKMKTSFTEGVLIIASPYDAGLITQEISFQNWKPELFASSWAQGDMLFQAGGNTIEGLEIMAFFNVNDQSPKLEEFKTDYEEMHGITPIFTAMQGYETMQLLAMALEKTNGSAENLGNELIGIQDYTGLTGPVKLDAYGDVLRNLTIQKVINGRFVTIKNLEMPQ
jgi:branched-chain amino acid transport system substrate-binding protein